MIEEEIHLIRLHKYLSLIHAPEIPLSSRHSSQALSCWG